MIASYSFKENEMPKMIGSFYCCPARDVFMRDVVLQSSNVVYQKVTGVLFRSWNVCEKNYQIILDVTKPRKEN